MRVCAASHPTWFSLPVCFSRSVFLTAWPRLAKRKTARDFRRWCRTFTRSIETRLENYTALLRAGAGLFAATDRVEENEFRNFVKTLGLAEHYPGSPGDGFLDARQARERGSADGGKEDVKASTIFICGPNRRRFSNGLA